MIELTQDRNVIIIHRQHNMIIYYDCKDDRNWVIYGKCRENKDCNGVYELDCPVTPEIKCNCGLRGVWVGSEVLS